VSAPSIVLFGSKPASVVALSILIERGWDVRHVVVARNFDLSWYGGESVEELATQHGVPVVEQAELPREAVDYVVSYQFRNLVQPDVLALAQRAALNFHAAPLPEFGGFAFYNVAILEDVSEYGVSCHHMEEEFDTGPLVKVRRFPIEARLETAYSLEARAQEEMLRLFVEVCEMAESDRPLPAEPQDPSRSRYFDRQRMEALKKIPAGAGEDTVDRYARAFWYPPYECAFVEMNGARVEVVPALARRQLGPVLHTNDLERLRRAIYIGPCMDSHPGRSDRA
jgi:methionyl-tRNA formyltransferase